MPSLWGSGDRKKKGSSESTGGIGIAGSGSGSGSSSGSGGRTIGRSPAMTSVATSPAHQSNFRESSSCESEARQSGRAQYSRSAALDPEEMYVRQERIGKGSFGEVYKG